MQIDIHMPISNPEDGLRSYIERRLKFVLGPFTGRLGTIRVQITEVNGREKSCEIRAQLLPSRILIMQQTHDENLYAAIDRAAGQIGMSLGRHLERDRVRKHIVRKDSTVA